MKSHCPHLARPTPTRGACFYCHECHRYFAAVTVRQSWWRKVYQWEPWPEQRTLEGA